MLGLTASFDSAEGPMTTPPPRTTPVIRRLIPSEPVNSSSTTPWAEMWTISHACREELLADLLRRRGAADQRRDVIRLLFQQGGDGARLRFRPGKLGEAFHWHARWDRR